eukprot:Gb_30304 [translate_table: standard]
MLSHVSLQSTETCEWIHRLINVFSIFRLLLIGVEYEDARLIASDIYSPRAISSTLVTAQKKEAHFVASGDDSEDDEYVSFTEMKRWKANSPPGFGHGKTYDTSLEDSLLKGIEHAQKAHAANVNKLKRRNKPFIQLTKDWESTVHDGLFYISWTQIWRYVLVIVIVIGYLMDACSLLQFLMHFLDIEFPLEMGSAQGVHMSCKSTSLLQLSDEQCNRKPSFKVATLPPMKLACVYRMTHFNSSTLV